MLAGSPRFTAQKLRVIFVAERRSSTAVQGPSEVGASMAMGNSPAMWDRVYDRSFRRREMQAAVDAMSVWRQAALGNTETPVADVMPVAQADEIDISLSDDE